MPGFFTDFANNKVLDLFFGSAAYTPPQTLYIGLSAGFANKQGIISEPSAGGYARVAVANNAAAFPAAVAGTKSNAGTVTFPQPTVDWGLMQSLFIADAATGGNVLAMADLTAAKTIPAGSTPVRLSAGSLFLSHT